MATSKAKATQAVMQANQRGLDGFDDKQVADAIVAAHKAASLADKHSEAKAAAAYAVCCEAQRIRAINATIDAEAFASSWRYSMRGILPRLYAAKVTWVEQTERKLKSGDVEIGYKLTSYGRNISSDASQTGQYDIDAVGAGSLMGVRKAIKEAKQAEAEAAETDQERELRELRESYLELAKQAQSLLEDAESVEAWQMACEVMAELIVDNTPVISDADAEAVAA
jgi:hypothetical protein